MSFCIINAINVAAPDPLAHTWILKQLKTSLNCASQQLSQCSWNKGKGKISFSTLSTLYSSAAISMEGSQGPSSALSSFLQYFVMIRGPQAFDNLAFYTFFRYGYIKVVPKVILEFRSTVLFT